MSETEALAAASAGALTKHNSRAARGAGDPCLNCQTVLEGAFCHVCGQSADDFQRPIGKLIIEAFGDTFAFDGRLWRTLPKLVFRPGRLTKDYIEGKRVRYVPPFRMYLLSGILFFLALFVGLGLDTSGGGVEADIAINSAAEVAAPVESGVSGEMAAESATSLPERIAEVDWGNTHAEIDRNLTGKPAWMLSLAHQLADGVEAAGGNTALFMTVVQTWAPRLSFLLMPIFAMLLVVAFPFRKGVKFFTHLIASMHFQTVMYLQSTLALLLGMLGWGAVAALFWFLVPPVYLLAMLRTVYGSGVFLSLIRVIFLILGSAFAMTMLVVAVFLLSLLTI
jgi:hypothetical protein